MFVCKCISSVYPTLSSMVRRKSRVLVDRTSTLGGLLVNMPKAVQDLDVTCDFPSSLADMHEAAVGADVLRLDINGRWPISQPCVTNE